MNREKLSLIASHTFAEPSDFSTLKEVTGMAGQRVGRDVLRVRPDARDGAPDSFHRGGAKSAIFGRFDSAPFFGAWW